MKFEIDRGNAVGYNLVGKLRGTKGTRSILIVSNLDGFGKLPDGRIYETAKGSAVAIGLMTDLMDYYQTHRPEYNIIFAMVGSKWTSNEGIRDLIRKINWGTIAYTFDLYALGGKGEFFVSYTDDRQKESMWTSFSSWTRRGFRWTEMRSTLSPLPSRKKSYSG